MSKYYRIDKESAMFFVSIVVVLALAGKVNTAEIPAVSATTSGSWYDASPPGNLIDPADLDENNRHYCGDCFTAFWMTGTTAGGTGTVSEEWCFIDLGSDKDLGQINIWNYYEDTAWAGGLDTSGRCVADYSLWVAGDGAALPSQGAKIETPFTVMDGWIQVVTGTLTKAPNGGEGGVTGPPIDPTDTLLSANGYNARYVGIDIITNYNGAMDDHTGLSQIQVTEEIAFDKAHSPDPHDTDTDVIPDKVLSWLAPTSFTPTGYNVYIDVDETKVIAGTGCAYTASNQPGTSFDPVPDLMSNSTYHWRVKSLGDPNNLDGDVWTFSTKDYSYKAYRPDPFDTGVNVRLGKTLSWNVPMAFTPTGYDVYIDADVAKVIAGSGCAYTSLNQPGTSFDPNPDFTPEVTYHWRVDSLGNPEGAPGDLWTFSTVPLVIEQETIDKVELMPNIPSPFQMKDWTATTQGYDAFVFDFNTTGDYLPLIWWDTSNWNFERDTFGLPSHVGSNMYGPDIGDGSVHENLTSMSAVLSATLVGIDKSNQWCQDTSSYQNWVLMLESFFNIDTGENLFLGFSHTHSGVSFFYELLPSTLMSQINYYYPSVGEIENELIITADKLYDASVAMGGSANPWEIPNFNHTAFNFMSMTPVDNGVWTEPDAAGGYAWLEYIAWVRWQDQKYLDAADWAMQFLHTHPVNPLYDVMLPYGVYVAARMNAELGRNYDLDKILNWCFGDGVYNNGWGVDAGNTWGDYDVDGLSGSVTSGPYGGYLFAMETFNMAGLLMPVVRYDDRYAGAIGKWLLNLANNARLFYPDALPADHQSSSFWTGDPNNVIAYEALKKTGWGSSFASDHSTVTGTILSGSDTDTYKQDAIYEVIQETTVGSYDALEHIWQFSLPAGATPDYLVVIGHIVDGGDADYGFKFSYSGTPGGTYTNMFTVSSTSDTVNWYPGFGGLTTIYIKAKDSNHISGTMHDTLYVDQMYLRYNIPKTPYAMGDSIMYGVGATDFGLYGSGWVGILGGTISTTNQEHILQIDCLKTDYYHDNAYPTYLYYNPEVSPRSVNIDVGPSPKDLYDTVSNTFLAQYVTGTIDFQIPADSAVVLVVTPAMGERALIDGTKLRIDGVIVDFTYSAEDLENSFTDWEDVESMASSWLQSGENMPEDFNRDKVINLKDFAILGANWSGY